MDPGALTPRPVPVPAFGPSRLGRTLARYPGPPVHRRNRRTDDLPRNANPPATPQAGPRSALLDTYTIYNELGRLENLKIGLVGDLANGRTVRSLASMMTNFSGVSFYFIAPDVVKMGQDIKDELDEKGIRWEESEDLLGVASEVDVLYQTRIQKERFGDRLDEYTVLVAASTPSTPR